MMEKQMTIVDDAHVTPGLVVDPEKAGLPVVTANSTSSREDPYESEGSADFQLGVERVRAITSSWSPRTLWLMFGLLYLVSFVDLMITSLDGALNPFITSSFGKHGLLATTSIISSILSGCGQLTLAKIIDIWGRVEGFLFMLLLVTIALIMKATCTTMEAYVAADTLQWTGHIGLIYVVDIVIADCTTLKNRMIIFGINGTPMIISTFVGPIVAQAFYERLNFRWAFGAFAIILLGVCLPVAAIMLWEQRKAYHNGVLTKKSSGRRWYESIWHYIVLFDAMGIFLITAAFALILLPFSIVYYAPRGWAEGYIIAMEVLGVFCAGVFYLWEAKFATHNFLPWKYLKNPTIIGSCMLYGIMFISTFIWNRYFYSYLQVVHRLDITTANYVLNAYSLSSSILSPVIGVLISYTGDYKWTSYAGVPLMLLGTVLLVPFRQPDTHVGLITLTQVLVGIGAGLFATCGQLAVMVPVTHQEVAVVVAIWGMFGSIGASIGVAIAGGIWNNVLPSELLKRLPEAHKADYQNIFGNIEIQMDFADGTLEREAVVGAYAHVQRLMVICGAAIMPLCILAVFVWRNVNLRKLELEKGKQTKGTVF